MKITSIQPYNFTSQNIQNKPKSYLDNFSIKVKNSADLSDTITVPRTIFKGYLGVMSGMTLLTLGGLTSKFPKISKPLNILGTLVSMYGTWAFVRPFVLKDAKGIATK